MAFKMKNCVCGFCPATGCACKCHGAESLNCIKLVSCIITTIPTIKAARFAEFSRNDLFKWVHDNMDLQQRAKFYRAVHADATDGKSISFMVPSNIGEFGILLGDGDYSPPPTSKRGRKTVRFAGISKKCRRATG